MAPRKGGGKKKSGAKKRKSNIWDDYTAPAKDGFARDNDDEQVAKKAKREPKESMFGQWKKQKQAFLNKKRSFYGTVEQKKQAQLEQYLNQKQRQADALYEGKTLPVSKKKKKKSAQYGQRSAVTTTKNDEKVETDDESESSESDGDELMVTKRKKKSSVFDQFVQTFQPAAFVSNEDEEDNDEDEYEEVLVDENGQEIDEDGNVIERDEDEEDGEDADQQDDAASDEGADEIAEEEEADEDVDEKEQLELAQDQDPYRSRYLLTEFEERDAKKFDNLPKKFTALAPQNEQGQSVHHASPSEYTVSFRNGLNADDAPAPLNSKVYVRSRLANAWKGKGLNPETLWTPNSLEYSLFHQFESYKDVFFAAQTYESTETLRRLSAMHVLNHIIKARDTVARNNERLRKRQVKEKEKAAGDATAAAEIPTVHDVADDDEEKEYRDQGFCRASVLVLLPLRSSALAFVKLLLELLPANVDTFHNKDRFFSEYGSAKDEDSENEDDEQNDKTDDNDDDDGRKEWQKVFGEGNNDDCFQIGLSLSRKALRFYSEYHHADIILASPLGLRQQLGDEVVDLDDQDTASEVKLSTDFLTSIEVCVVDSASLMLMQNIEHLRHVVRAINVPPREAPNADFARIREWNLAFLGVYFRQTIVYAHGVEPALNHLVTKCCKNMSGLIKYVRWYDPADGSASIARVVPQIKQIFQRIDLDHTDAHLSAAQENELRFAYFQKHVFEPLLDHPKKHVLIFIPSYFDYVRVRNLFNDSMNKKLIRTVQCCEYTTSKQTSRARTSFFHGKAQVMLFTERFHFYHQYQIRGVHQIVWYGVPQIGAFYAEMLNMLGEKTSRTNDDDDDDEALHMDDGAEGKNSIALFTRLDLFRMQRIVGNKRAERMCHLKASKPTFLFC
ncbi:Digestive organ expansion factor, partial [Globisporangium splendens]